MTTAITEVAPFAVESAESLADVSPAVREAVEALDAQETSEVEEIDASYETKLARLADLYVDSIEYRGKTREHYNLGRMARQLGLAQVKSIEKSQGTTYGKKDFKRLQDRVVDLVLHNKRGVGADVRQIRVDDDVKLYLWIEHVKKHIPAGTDVFSVPCGIILNVFIQGDRFTFDVAKLVGSVPERWLTFMVSSVLEILSDRPYDAKGATTTFGLKLAADSRAKQDPTEALRKEQVAADNALKAKKQAARDSVRDAVTACTEAGITPAAVSFIAVDAWKDSKVTDLTGFGREVVKTIGPDPATMTADDAKTFVKALVTAGNFDALCALQDAIASVLNKIAAKVQPPAA